MNGSLKPHNFSLAFEQMCNFAAIAKTQDADESLKQLIQLCLVLLPDDRFEDASQIKDAMTLFDLQFSEHQVQAAIDRMMAQGLIERPTNTYFTLPERDREQLQKRIDEVKALEQKVKQEWLEEVARKFPALPVDQIWKALQMHLSSVFRNHGIQAIAILDPLIDTSSEQAENLSSLLNDALKNLFPPEQRIAARNAISGFLATAGEHPERAKYITQLGDGVFTYFSLTVEPGVARRFQKQLKELVLFFDTNFLFQICNFYGIGPEKEASHELLRVIERHQFPFKLRYHQATRQEMRTTIDHYGTMLRSGRSSSVPASIELAFQELNARTGIDVDTFLKPYEHFDAILTEKNILIHRAQAGRKRESDPLLQQYRRFLQIRGKSKGEELLKHDVTLLEAVHQLRSKSMAKSSLEAGALLVTLDTFLYRFDWEISRAEGRPACVVLPDHFMQVLSPFVPSDADFDRSFATTFALPEFRAMESKLTEAQQQLTGYLTSYEPFSEETAANILTNGLLIERLHKVENDEHLQKDVESRMARDNASWLEEKAVLEKLLEQERMQRAAERAASEKQLEQERSKAEQEARARAEQAEELLRQKDKEIALLKKQVGRQGTNTPKQQKTQPDQDIEQTLKAVQQAKEEAERQAQQTELQRQAAERKMHSYAFIASFAISMILVLASEIFVRLIDLQWLQRQPHSPGLQISFIATIFLLITGFFHPHWRRWCWGPALLAFASLMIQLL